MNKKKIRELVMNAGIFAVIMGLTFWSVFRGQDIAEIVGAIGQMSGVYLAASAFLAVFFVAGETVRKPLRGDNRILNVGLSPKQS